MKKDYPYIHFLRLAATLAIVLLHTSSTILGNKSSFTEFDNSEEYLFSIYKYLMEWGVPVFAMISGALFLAPDKQTSYGIIIKKYVKKIFFALLVFGLPMALSESVLTYRNEPFSFIFFNGLENWACGHSWAHMWYLYMLIGLYLITPIIKPFINIASNKEIEISLIVLFVMSSILPTLKNNDIHIEGYMLISTPFIFIYMLGFYLHARAERRTILNSKFLWITLLLIASSAILYKIINGIDFNGYVEPWCIIMAASIFSLSRILKIDCKIAKRLAPLCFAVYLIHPFFINLSYKIMDITPLNVPGNTNCAISILIFWIGFTAFSFLAAYIICKLPFIKKFV